MLLQDYRQISHTELPRLGVGAMPMAYDGKSMQDAYSVWQHCFDLGISLINTADIYCPSPDQFGFNERQVGEVVRASGRDKAFVVTKNGIRHDGTRYIRDNSPEYLLRAAELSNERLGFMPDAILLHRLNREQSLEAAIHALCEVRDRGFTKYIGVSNVHLNEFHLAFEASEGALAFVENERSPRFRKDYDVVEACEKNGVAYLAWSPLGGGSEAKNLGTLYPEFQRIANTYSVSAQQIALTWLRQTNKSIIAIPAFTSLHTADDSYASLSLELSESDITTLDQAVTPNQSVYPD
jgi:aryl-alcohol dehydrogenase-like predicted oxidoreductase